jgi:hypothetical protein
VVVPAWVIVPEPALTCPPVGPACAEVTRNSPPAKDKAATILHPVPVLHHPGVLTVLEADKVKPVKHVLSNLFFIIVFQLIPYFFSN